MIERATPKDDLEKVREIRDPRVWRVIEMLSESLKLNAAGLAAKVNLSPSRLSRIFKNEAGIGLGQYLSILRMRSAASLLGETGEPIKRIAASLGYSHQSSFVRAFQDFYAETPRSYRRKRHRATSPHRFRLAELLDQGEAAGEHESPLHGPE